ncbi:MAG: hypothetical protein JWP06_551 [Candidatus Saccharibacteria bacterium]|nr:hypothetical protein [Candidatus Saccharibacteria bacterium]
MSTPVSQNDDSSPRFIGQFDDFKLKYSSHRDVDGTKRGQTGIYVDYESGEWNYRQFITWFGEHLPSFALTPSELSVISDRGLTDKLERAAGIFFDKRPKGKYDTRGEVGELILHGVMRDIYATTPLISKIYYKTAPGDPVKGADAVHAIIKDGEVDSLWLGEAKFYMDSAKGISAAVASITGMIDRLKDRKEFIFIRHHLDKDDSNREKVEKLISNAVSLDEIKAKICVPVLVTYESPVTKAHNAVNAQFIEQLDAELAPLFDSFFKQVEGINEIDIHIFFMPLKDKATLVATVDKFIDGKKSIF